MQCGSLVLKLDSSFLLSRISGVLFDTEPVLVATNTDAEAKLQTDEESKSDTENTLNQ